MERNGKKREPDLGKERGREKWIMGGRKRRWRERKIGEGRTVVVPSLPLLEEHPIGGNRGGRSRKKRNGE